VSSAPAPAVVQLPWLAPAPRRPPAAVLDRSSVPDTVKLSVATSTSAREPITVSVPPTVTVVPATMQSSGAPACGIVWLQPAPVSSTVLPE
jgi:hypothetical protein